MKVVAMIPVKLNNRRFPGKNLKCFDDGVPLLHLIQRATLGSELTSEVYVFCSTEEIRPFLLEKVHFLKRSPQLDQDTANSNDLLRAFINEVDADIYYTTHATAPFTTSEGLDACISSVASGKYDSAFMAEKVQKFIWKEGEPLNFDPAHIVRTQDLAPFYVETSNAFVFTKDVFTTYGRRVGANPYIYECSTIEGIDIDYPDDFVLANAVYMNVLKRL